MSSGASRSPRAAHRLPLSIRGTPDKVNSRGIIPFIFTSYLYLWYISLVNIGEIQQAFIERTFRYTKHGAEQRINRGISSDEIDQAVLDGEIIEDYPFDKYGPSCLVSGKTEEGRALHIQIALYPIISIVTVYEPTPEKWIDDTIRR